LGTTKGCRTSSQGKTEATNPQRQDCLGNLWKILSTNVMALRNSRKCPQKKASLVGTKGGARGRNFAKVTKRKII